MDYIRDVIKYKTIRNEALKNTINQTTGAFMKNFISFDLETTGTLSHEDDIVEIGAVRFEEGKAKEHFQSLISIDKAIPEEASRVNGITDEMLKGQPRIEDVLPDFANFCGDHLIVAHNAPFDFQFLLRAIEEHRSPAPRGVVLDTCQLARKTFSSFSNYKLSTCCQHLKIGAGEGFHRAKADALYCGELFLAILKKNNFSTDQVQDLIKLSGRVALKFPEIHQEQQMGLF